MFSEVSVGGYLRVVASWMSPSLSPEPDCSRTLADLGADVINLDPLGRGEPIGSSAWQGPSPRTWGSLGGSRSEAACRSRRGTGAG